MSKRPVSKACPKCGANEYTRWKPDRLVAFAADRVCAACHTRYSPPTPVWGAVICLLAAPVLALLGFYFIVLLFGLFSCLGLVCQVALGVFVVVVFLGGIRLSVESGQHAARVNSTAEPNPAVSNAPPTPVHDDAAFKERPCWKSSS
jgi:hypothetical protein